MKKVICNAAKKCKLDCPHKKPHRIGINCLSICNIPKYKAKCVEVENGKTFGAPKVCKWELIKNKSTGMFYWKTSCNFQKPCGQRKNSKCKNCGKVILTKNHKEVLR